MERVFVDIIIFEANQSIQQSFFNQSWLLINKKTSEYYYLHLK